MKKFIRIFLIIIVIFITLTGCGNAQKDRDDAFTEIERQHDLTIYKENKTDVLYVVYHSGYGGGITIMFDECGVPLTYTNWIKE